MEHVGELLEEGRNALFVSNALPVGQRVSQYVDALTQLIQNRALRESIAVNNRSLTEQGKLSISRRNEILGLVYEEACGIREKQGGAFIPLHSKAGGRGSVLDWSEQVCHWETARYARAGTRINL